MPALGLRYRKILLPGPNLERTDTLSQDWGLPSCLGSKAAVLLWNPHVAVSAETRPQQTIQRKQQLILNRINCWSVPNTHKKSILSFILTFLHCQRDWRQHVSAHMHAESDISDGGTCLRLYFLGSTYLFWSHWVSPWIPILHNNITKWGGASRGSSG